MEKICCILDTDETYAVRIAACFNNKKVLPFIFRAFSDTCAYEKCAGENDIEILLVEEKLYSKLRDSLEKRKNECTAPGLTVVLCENSLLMENSSPGTVCISKYQAGDEIIRDVVSLYGDIRPDALLTQKSVGAKLVAVYSPNGGVGKTTLALAFSHIKGQTQKVLYISFDEFSDFGTHESTYMGNFSDALYYYFVGKDAGIGKIMSIISRGNGFDYIPPTDCAEDLPHFTCDVVRGMIELIAGSGGYELVVMDIGALVKEPWKLLCLADTVLMLKPDTVHRQRKQAAFERYMHESGMGEVLDKSIFADIQWEEGISKDGTINYGKLRSGGFGRLVRTIDI